MQENDQVAPLSPSILHPSIERPIAIRNDGSRSGNAHRKMSGSRPGNLQRPATVPANQPHKNEGIAMHTPSPNERPKLRTKAASRSSTVIRLRTNSPFLQKTVRKTFDPGGEL